MKPINTKIETEIHIIFKDKSHPHFIIHISVGYNHYYRFFIRQMIKNNNTKLLG